MKITLFICCVIRYAGKWLVLGLHIPNCIIQAEWMNAGAGGLGHPLHIFYTYTHTFQSILPNDKSLICGQTYDCAVRGLLYALHMLRKVTTMLKLFFLTWLFLWWLPHIFYKVFRLLSFAMFSLLFLSLGSFLTCLRIFAFELSQ